jgi:hypothetical protein
MKVSQGRSATIVCSGARRDQFIISDFPQL